MRRSGTVATALLAGLVLVAVGASGTLVFVARDEPAGVGDAVAPTVAPASVITFSDERSATGVPTIATPGLVLLQDSGTVTSTACSPGGVISSGMSPVMVDDRPLLALSTGTPMWRDVAIGSRGEDVRALQRELVRLGLAVEVNGSYDRATAAAMQSLREAIGVVRPRTGTLRASLVWIPAPQVVVESCEMAVGAAVSAGEVFATTEGTLQSIRVDLPSGLVEGDRVAQFEDVSTALPAPRPDGLTMITDPAFLQAVSTSPAYALIQSKASTEVDSLPLTVSLTEPETLLAVPPFALTSILGSDACLQFEGAVHRVTIIASRLGSTLVRLPDDVTPPLEVDLPTGQPTC